MLFLTLTRPSVSYMLSGNSHTVLRSLSCGPLWMQASLMVRIHSL
jgi:hypothetical protein